MAAGAAEGDQEKAMSSADEAALAPKGRAASVDPLLFWRTRSQGGAQASEPQLAQCWYGVVGAPAAVPSASPNSPPRGADGGGIPPENWLLLVSAWEYLSLMISTQASNQVWLDFYAGDYGAQTRAMSRLSAAGGLLGFFVKPLLAQASDVCGRKPLLLLSYVVQVVAKGGIAVAPPSVSVPLLAVSQYLLGFVTWELSQQTIDSAIGTASVAHEALLEPKTLPAPVRGSTAGVPASLGWLAARALTPARAPQAI
jgi:hypothetical protein